MISATMTVVIFHFFSQPKPGYCSRTGNESSLFLTLKSALSFHVFLLFYGVSARFRPMASPITLLQPSFFLAATLLSRIWNKSTVSFQTASSNLLLDFPTSNIFLYENHQSILRDSFVLFDATSKRLVKQSKC